MKMDERAKSFLTAVGMFLASATAMLVAFEILLLLLGFKPWIRVPVWFVFGFGLMGLILFVQADTAFAKAKRGIKTPLAAYSWIAPTVPVVLIMVVIQPVMLTMSMFGWALIVVWLMVLPIAFMFFESEYPGWVAELVEKQNREYLLKTRKVIDACASISYDFMFGMVFLGVGLGVSISAVVVRVMLGELYIIAAVAMLLGLLMVFQSIGIFVPEKSYIDGKPLIEGEP